MWLVERGTDGTGQRRIALPSVVRSALVRWYTGTGSHDDENAGIMLVQQARIGERWIACDCLPPTEPPAILTPAFLSEAETYYLRRLTSSKRPEHRAECPFFRDQVTHRITERRGPEIPAEPPAGFFQVLKPAPEKLAQRPDDDPSDDRTRQASVPRLARLLWRLMAVAGSNCCAPLSAVLPERSIITEFRTLTGAAGGIEVAPGIELARVLWTHAAALHRRRVFASLRALAERWPAGHAPQGFLVLFASAFRGHEIFVADGEPIRVANRVQSPSSRDNPVEGPYLAIVVAGQYPEAHGYAPLRAYAQPIYSGHRFIPVNSAFERQTIKALLAAQRALDRDGVDLAIEKPIFDRLTPLGPCRPDFVIEARSRSTGEVRRIAVQAIGSPDADYRTVREPTIARLRTQLTVIEIGKDDVKDGRVTRLLTDALELGCSVPDRCQPKENNYASRSPRREQIERLPAPPRARDQQQAAPNDREPSNPHSR